MLCTTEPRLPRAQNVVIVEPVSVVSHASDLLPTADFQNTPRRLLDLMEDLDAMVA